MMVTARNYLKGDVSPLIEKMVRNNFLAVGVEEGRSPFIVSVNLLETHSDARGPNHVYVRVRIPITILQKESNTPVFHKVLDGYAVESVVQLGNEAHEKAFVSAMNAINDTSDCSA